MRQWESIVNELFEEYKELSIKKNWYACSLNDYRGGPYFGYENELERKIYMLPLENRLAFNKLAREWSKTMRPEWDRKLDLERQERLRAKGKI